MCNKEIGSNSIKYLVCGFWVQKCFSNVKGPLKTNPDLKCKKCRGEVSNATIPDINHVHINGEEIRKVRYFCYLSDFIGKCGGCFDTTTARVTCAWEFRALFPILTCHGLSLKTHRYAYNGCVHSVLLYASETWAGTQHDISHLNCNDMMMMKWICSMKLTDTIKWTKKLIGCVYHTKYIFSIWIQAHGQEQQTRQV